jgi:hypothetical protein
VGDTVGGDRPGQARPPDDDEPVTADLGIEGYERAAPIGRGGFATVYRAWQPGFQRHVAIKVVDPAGLDDDGVHRFERECAAIGALSGHPNIVTVHDHGRTGDGRPYIVMEFMSGGSLGDAIDDSGPLPWSTAVEIAVKLAGALESAHRAGVLHRDVKPENVLRSRFGEAKLADFGIARVEGRTSTEPGSFTASLAHVAPELLAGEEPSVASDVYSLGSTLFTLIAGHPPFVRPDDESLGPLLGRIAAAPVPDLRPAGVPDPVCTVLEQALAKDPAARPATAAATGRLLEAAQAEAGATVTPLLLEAEHGGPSPPPPPAAPAGRRRLWPLGVAALALVAAGIWGAASIDGPTPTTTTIAGSVLFRDPFTRIDGWVHFEGTDLARGLAGETYRVALKKPNRIATLAPTPDLPADVRIEVDATAAEADQEAGVGCRGDAADLKPRYEARIAASGLWHIDKVDAVRDTDAEKLAPGPDDPARSAAIRPTGVNHVSLECVGDGPVALRLTVNGARVGEVSDPRPLAGNRAGLVVLGPAGTDVRFDNLVITAL